MVAVVAFVGEFFAEGFLPEGFAVGAVEAEEDELVDFGGGFAAHGSGCAAAALAGWALRGGCGGSGGRCVGGGAFGFFAGGDGGLDEDAVAPDDGGGCAGTGEGGFPAEVGFFVELGRWGGVGGGTVVGWAAPFGPVGVGGGGGEEGGEEGRGEQDGLHGGDDGVDRGDEQGGWGV